MGKTNTIAIIGAPPEGLLSKRRLDWVDYARGIAIILVVTRHVLVGLQMSGLHIPTGMYNIQEYTLNFRIPVFFMLSGVFLAASSLKYKPASLLRQKVSTLLYPYLLWTIILITLQIFFSQFTNGERTPYDYLYIIIQPRELEHLWYLLALFNTSCLFILGWKWLKTKPYLHILLAVLLHFSSFLLKDYSLFSDPFYHYIFFLLGAYIAEYIHKFDGKSNRELLQYLLIITPVFIVGQYFWLHSRPETMSLVIPFMLVILIACCFYYFFCRFLYNLGVFKWLSIVGKNSLYIYILHIFFVAAFRTFCMKVLKIDNVYILAPLALFIGITLPMAANYCFKKAGMWYMFRMDKPQSSKLIRTNG